MKNIGIGGMEQLLIAMDATCKLLECATADYGDRPSLIGICAIAQPLAINKARSDGCFLLKE